MPCLHTVRQHSNTILSASRARNASTTPFVWVSDALLADAFARFVRVSQSHKRHHSYVPGPLEARRRLSRRRMGSTGLAAAVSLENADYRPVLGLTSESLAAGSVQWTPPQSSLQTFIGAPPPPPPLPCSASMEEDFNVEENIKTEMRGVLQPEEHQKEPGYTIEHSQKAMRDLSSSQPDIYSISAVDLQPLLDFLRSPEDVRDAHNTLQLVQWLQNRSLTEEGLRALVQTIVDKIRLGTSTMLCLQEVISCLDGVTAWQQSQQIMQVLVESYVDLHDVISKQSHRMSDSTRAQVLHTLYLAGVQDNAELDIPLLAFRKLESLHPDGTSSRRKMTSNLLARIITIYITSNTTQTQSDAVLKSLTRVINTIRQPALVRQALTTILQDADASDAERDMRATILMRSLHASTRLDTTQWPTEAIEQSWAAYDALGLSSLLKDVARCFVDIVALQRSSAIEINSAQQPSNAHRASVLPAVDNEYNHLWSKHGTCMRALCRPSSTTQYIELQRAFDLLQGHDVPVRAAINHILQALLRAGQTTATRTLLLLVQKFLPAADLVPYQQQVLSELWSRRKMRHALRLYAADHRIAPPEDFARKWFQEASIDGEAGTTPIHNPLKLALDCLRGRRVIPIHIRGFLEHLATITASRCAPWSSRQSFRCISECIQFLQDRGCAGSSVLSRALLQAGTMQRLQARDVVSSQRLTHTCKIIATVEGSRVGMGVQNRVEQLHAQYMPDIMVKRRRACVTAACRWHHP